jgi:PIN domain nuclease of toxin-antitoxin system
VRLLLDTHLLLWVVAGDAKRLSGATIALIETTENEVWFSAASVWEIVIKRGLGRQDFRVDPRLLRRALLENGYSELQIASEHAIAVEALPPIHRDPFDRMLVAQATIEGITLLTSDRTIARYPGPIQKV